MNVVRPIFRSTTLTGGKSGAAAANSLKYSSLYALDVLFNIFFSFPARMRLVEGLSPFQREVRVKYLNPRNRGWCIHKNVVLSMLFGLS